MASSQTPTPRSTTTSLAVLAAGAVVLLAALAFGVRDGRLYGWDRPAVDFFDEHYYDLGGLRTVVEAAVWATIAGGAVFAVALTCALVLARGYRRAVFWALTVGGAVALTSALKEVVERPEIGQFDTEYSFPSGNATASMAAASAIFLLTRGRLRRYVAAAAGVVVPVYGVALVLLLWHYPSDVVGGWALAVALVAGLRLGLGDVSGPLPGRRGAAHPFSRSSSRAQ